MPGCGLVRCGAQLVQCGAMVQGAVLQCGVVWYGVVWYGMVWSGSKSTIGYVECSPCTCPDPNKASKVKSDRVSDLRVGPKQGRGGYMGSLNARTSCQDDPWMPWLSGAE